jgi:hypothetical protein
MRTKTSKCPPRAFASAEIAAPIELVWSTMLDMQAYGEWNPFILRVDGLTGVPVVGQVLRLQVRWANGWTVRSTEVIERLEPPTRDGGIARATLVYGFRGPLHALHFVRASRWQVLEQHPGGPTLYRTEEDFHGLLARLVPRAAVQDGFERHALALKARAELLVQRSRGAS